MTSEKRRNRIRKRRWQTAYAFPRVPRGVRAMPVKHNPAFYAGMVFHSQKLCFIVYVFLFISFINLDIIINGDISLVFGQL